MDFDDDLSGLQIEDLGEYFLQTDINDSWKGFTLGYTDEEHQQTLHDSNVSVAAARSSAQPLTSPPVSKISERLQHGKGLEMELSLDLLHKNVVNFDSIDFASANVTPTTATMNRFVKGTSEFETFDLDQVQRAAALAIVGSPTRARLDSNIKSAAPQTPSPQCQNILTSLDANMSSNEEASTFFRNPDVMVASCEPSGCSIIGNLSTLSASDDGRGFRKKSREKMRRQEVNTKFEELVDLLGLSNRVRKSAILHEAVSTIKSLKRERDDLRRERDCMQLEVNKLATWLQYSHLGSVAAVAMTQPLQQHVNASVQHCNQQHGHQAPARLNGMQTVHTHPLHIPCNSGTNCLPLGPAFSQLGSQMSSKSGQVAIAPKLSNPSCSVPDTEMT